MVRQVFPFILCFLGLFQKTPLWGEAPLTFQLQAEVKGPTTLYPGQRTTLFYQIIYNRNVDLTQSTLPFVHPAHFQKIGDVRIQEQQKGEETIQELSQEIEASEIGTFALGPSLIEGHVYTLSASGEKIYDPSLVKAEAPAITLEVKPFPSAHQPFSFTGALGDIQAEASLAAPPFTTVGETVSVKLVVSGISNLASFYLPSLKCQPGFSGFFQLSDLPPLAEIKGESKIFNLELTPLLSEIDHIPSIEVSSFDPNKASYVARQTLPIPLTVRPLPAGKSSFLPQPLIHIIPVPIMGQWPEPSLAPLEIQGQELALKELKTSEPNISQLLQEANHQYRAGEAASTLKEREEAFNQALSLYSVIQQHTHSSASSLNRAIADSFFQLQAYPWAILYYERALASDPNDSLALFHLQKAQAKLGIAPLHLSFFTAKWQAFISSLFHKETLLGLVLIALMTASATIWLPCGRWRLVAICFFLLTILSLFGIFFSYYFSSLEGVLVNSTSLYRSPDVSQPPIANTLLLPGQQVKILHIDPSGEWLKVEESNGMIGFVLASDLRLK